jgi:hypothetical protein
MAKKIRFNTISLGSEPDQPGIPAIAAFIQHNKGYEADLISCMLTESLKAQKEAGILSLCAGGDYILPRFDTAISCSEEECHVDTSSFILDAQIMMNTAMHAKSALFGPELIPSCPKCSDEELYADFCDLYADILRCMRDCGVVGHILHAQRICPIDSERLASRKTWFAIPDGEYPAQESILEFQKTLILRNEKISMLSTLLEQYEIRSLVILEPNLESLYQALEYFDPEQISIGGFAKGDERAYWKKLEGNSTIPMKN